MNEPDFNPEDEAQVNEALAHESIRPGEIFQGKHLWPFTKGSKAIYAMLTSDNDTLVFRYLAFAFVHVRRTRETMEQDIEENIIPLAFGNLNAARAKIMIEFYETLSSDDILRAREIFKKEMELLRLTEIAATPPEAGAVEKKSRPVAVRQRKPGKSSKPPKS